MRYSRRTTPSQYRCLKALYPTGIALLILFMWDTVTAVICTMQILSSSPIDCRPSMPVPLIWTLILLVSAGLIHFFYRVYRDFYCGDLLVDRM